MDIVHECPHCGTRCVCCLRLKKILEGLGPIAFRFVFGDSKGEKA